MCSITSGVGILTVGSELTDGAVQETHGKYIASALKQTGFTIKKMCTIPDEPELFKSELLLILQQCSIVVITGGLGPTSDDITREIISDVIGRSLIFREDIWTNLQSRFRGASRIPDVNRKQAYVPEGFSVFENEHGTAPGLYGFVGEKLIAAFPGPPRELRPMVDVKFIPFLASQFRKQQQETTNGTAFLVPESVLEEALQQETAQTAAERVFWRTRVEPLRILFSIYGGPTDDRKAVFQRVKDRLGSLHIREGIVDQAAHLLRELKERDLWLVSAESCTGGFVGKVVTDVSGSSAVFWGALVTYSNEAKQQLLGVGKKTLETYGAVSGETVEEMAFGALDRSGADIAVAISGIAGPAGGSLEKPVGTVWICTAYGRKVLSKEYRFFGGRDLIRRWSTVAALLQVEEALGS